MSGRRKPKAHLIYDCDEVIGFVRYDGDPDDWQRLARQVLDDCGCEQEQYDNLAAPRLGWWRFVPCTRDERDALGWHWRLMEVDGPGPGQFQGAEVRFRLRETAAVAS